MLQMNLKICNNFSAEEMEHFDTKCSDVRIKNCFVLVFYRNLSLVIY